MINTAMSVSPSRATPFLSSINNSNDDDKDSASDRESFQKLFEHWLVQQNQHLHALISVSKQHQINSNNNFNEEKQLIQKVIEHYEQYYRAKSRWVYRDVLGMWSPSWRSSLEDAFTWNGGWRPTMAFHLLYSKSGLQLEAKLHDLIRGLRSGDLGDLSPSQLTRIDDLQRITIKAEKDLSEKLAKYQETAADSSMVELSHVVTELMNGGDDDGAIIEDQVESTLKSKEEKLEEVLHKADDLRLRTLKSIVGILSPIQAIHFLIAAAELHLRVHDWGKKRDAAAAHGSV